MLAALAASSTREAGRSRRCQRALLRKRHVSTRTVPRYSPYTHSTTDTQAPKSYHDGKHAARLQPRCCCTGAQRSACEACSPFLLSASPVRIAAECPPSVRARLVASVIGWMLQFPAILQYLVASEICSGKLGQGQQDCAIFDAGFESVGVEEAITAACSSCIRLYGVDRASQGTV